MTRCEDARSPAAPRSRIESNSSCLLQASSCLRAVHAGATHASPLRIVGDNASHRLAGLSLAATSPLCSPRPPPPAPAGVCRRLQETSALQRGCAPGANPCRVGCVSLADCAGLEACAAAHLSGSRDCSRTRVRGLCSPRHACWTSSSPRTRFARVCVSGGLQTPVCVSACCHTADQLAVRASSSSLPAVQLILLRQRLRSSEAALGGAQAVSGRGSSEAALSGGRQQLAHGGPCQHQSRPQQRHMAAHSRPQRAS